ncbi:MAG: leucine-rich repeat domain-containing protein, partial [Mycoplasma sp.]
FFTIENKVEGAVYSVTNLQLKTKTNTEERDATITINVSKVQDKDGTVIETGKSFDIDFKTSEIAPPGVFKMNEFGWISISEKWLETEYENWDGILTIPTKYEDEYIRGFTSAASIEQSFCYPIKEKLKEIRFSQENVEAPNTIKSWGLTNAFWGAAKLEKVIFGPMVEETGVSTFKDCVMLKEVVSLQANIINDAAFFGCVELSKIDISSADVISNNAFENCKKLETINLSNNINYIGTGAFKDSGLIGKLVLPDSILDMGAGVFSGCNLESIAVSQILLNKVDNSTNSWAYGYWNGQTIPNSNIIIKV